MRLGIFINPVARLRDEETFAEPEPAVIASLAMASGAQVILAGWTRTGGRIKDRDLRLLREVIKGDLMLLASVGSEFVEPVVKHRPQGVILVGSGWDGKRDVKPIQMEVDSEEITSASASYKVAGVPTFAFIDPDAAVVKSCARSGLAGVVIDAEIYSRSNNDEEAEASLEKIADCALVANKFGLIPAVAHGLDYHNVGPVVSIKFVEEVYIGRSIVARSLMTGIERATSDMLTIIDRSRNSL